MFTQQVYKDVILDEIKFCTKCASNVKYVLPPDGDIYKRFICSNINCQHIHYQNPKIIVGTISIYKQQILLCKRAIEPRYGYWTLPAGFMEQGETTLYGAARETQEEAQATANIEKLFAIINIPKIGQVHLFYLANFDGKYSSGIESLETKLFKLEDIPWQELAFPSVKVTLKSYIEYLNIANSHTNEKISLPFHHTVEDYRK